ncbi:MAG TPA: patatin-like phospholipase family protein, partial [Bacillota bacterium]
MADLVLEGGGVKGIGLVGALIEAEARGYRWVNLAGTSAGAIVAALVAAGYRAAELAAILEHLDYRRFARPSGLGRVPLIGLPLNLVFRLGLYSGDALETWVADLLAARGVRVFGDLVIPEFAGDPRYRYRLQVVATDLTRRRRLVLPRDARHYGLDPDAGPVARAVRMSAGVPFFFEPVILAGRRGRRGVIV